MSSSNKSKSRSEGNEPVKRLNIVESARSTKPPVVEAKNTFTERQTKTLPKKSTNIKPPLTSTRNNTSTNIKFHGDGRQSVNFRNTAIFDEGNPKFGDLNNKKAIKTAEQNKEGKVKAMIANIEQRSQQSKKGGKKTRKNKKSKKSKTRSKRC